MTISIPLNPLARKHRHNGFGFVGYQLVLSGRSVPNELPPAAASWLTAAFHDQHVIVVEDGIASAWQGRALRGRVHVDSRMDLWRLIADAAVCVDFDPGPVIARECIEAMRFGTPIMVPAGSGPATVHAAAGRGFACRRTRGADSGRDRPGERAASLCDVGAGEEYADVYDGDPTEFSESLRAVLSQR